MPEVRPATAADLELVVGVASAAFEDDPMMSWLFPDDATRRGRLAILFGGLAEDVLQPGRGTVLVADEAAVSIWRDPGFDHHPEPEEERADDEVVEAPSPFTADELGRLAILGPAMREAHPTEPHWYLNVVATLPAERSRGLGAAVLAPMIARADADGLPCYLESTNPRNRTLYYRHGFEDLGDIHLDEGVALRQMWRPPYSR